MSNASCRLGVGLSLLASPEHEKLLHFSVCKFLRVVLLFVP